MWRSTTMVARGRAMRALALALLLGSELALGRRSKSKKAPPPPEWLGERMGAAEAANAGGDVAGAFAELDEAIKRLPKQFAPYMLKGQIACKQDSYQLCESTYAAGLKAAPATHRNHFKQNIALELGQSAYRNGVSVKARNSDGSAREPGLRSPFKTALEQLEIAQSAGLGLVSAPGIRALYTQGQVYEAQAKADQGGWQGSAKSALAIAAWEEVIGHLESEPELATELLNLHTDCSTNLGVSYERLDRLVEAEAKFRTALSLKPAHQVAFAHLRDVVHWQHPEDPAQWQAVAQAGVDAGIWERIDQTPAMRYHRGVETVPWPAVGNYPGVAATVAALEAKTALIRDEMRVLMGNEGTDGLNFGAMEALASPTDGSSGAEKERGGWHSMIVDCDKKRALTPETCNTLEGVVDQ